MSLSESTSSESGGRSLQHATASVDAGARLVGPVQLGPGARVQAGATIVGPTTIGPDSTVGRNALVARSVVWGRCAVGEGSVVHGSVVGNHVVLLPGSRLFNVVRLPPPVSVPSLRVSWPARERPAAMPMSHGAPPAMVGAAEAATPSCPVA